MMEVDGTAGIMGYDSVRDSSNSVRSGGQGMDSSELMPDLLAMLGQHDSNGSSRARDDNDDENPIDTETPAGRHNANDQSGAFMAGNLQPVTAVAAATQGLPAHERGDSKTGTLKRHASKELPNTRTE